MCVYGVSASVCVVVVVVVVFFSDCSSTANVAVPGGILPSFELF